LRLLLVLMAAIGVLFVIVGQWRSGFWATVASDIGIAFTTAAILGIVIEAYLRERLFSQIEDKIEKTMQIFGSQLADGIQLQRLPPRYLKQLKRKLLNRGF